ncbi:MAG: response regulator [Longimicrobiales bacterium]
MQEQGPTLLVIEDAQDQALLVGIAARHAHPGLVVHNAYNGVDGISFLRDSAPFSDRPTQPTPDLVILDLFMPELDGFDVLAWIQERQSPPPFPLVVLTASPKPEDEARALALGAVAVHQKPTDLAGLGETVESIVQRWIGRGSIIGAHLWSMG